MVSVVRSIPSRGTPALIRPASKPSGSTASSGSGVAGARARDAGLDDVVGAVHVRDRAAHHRRHELAAGQCGRLALDKRVQDDAGSDDGARLEAAEREEAELSSRLAASKQEERALRERIDAAAEEDAWKRAEEKMMEQVAPVDTPCSHISMSTNHKTADLRMWGLPLGAANPLPGSEVRLILKP